MRLYPDVLNANLSYVQSLEGARSGLSTAKDRAMYAESQNSKDSRASGRSEAHYREQLADRNGLLHTVGQLLENVIGQDKSTVRLLGLPLQHLLKRVRAAACGCDRSEASIELSGFQRSTVVTLETGCITTNCVRQAVTRSRGLIEREIRVRVFPSLARDAQI